MLFHRPTYCQYRNNNNENNNNEIMMLSTSSVNYRRMQQQQKRQRNATSSLLLKNDLLLFDTKKRFVNLSIVIVVLLCSITQNRNHLQSFYCNAFFISSSSSSSSITTGIQQRQNHMMLFALSSEQQQQQQLKERRRRRKNKLLKKKGKINKNQQKYQLEKIILSHELLTKDEEHKLAIMYQNSKSIQEQLSIYLIQRKLQQNQQQLQHLENEISDKSIEEGDNDNDDYYNNNLSMYNSFEEWNPPLPKFKNILLQEHDASSRVTQATTQQQIVYNDEIVSLDYATAGFNNIIFPQDDEVVCNNNNNNLLLSTIIPDDITDNEIIENLHINGGRNELQNIILQGANARDILIRSNMKLVANISKKWARMNSNIEQQYSLHTIYKGSWDKPSLSEIIQEGTLGLIQAIERFNPKYNLRLSTYATFWITNSVRKCFQVTSTGTIRVPTKFYETKSQIKTLAKQNIDKYGTKPTIQQLATTLNIKEKRLLHVLRTTKPLLSIDSPTYSAGFTQAGKSGGGIADFDQGYTIADTLIDTNEMNPEDCIELSFLRTSLENAMATELAPHERDILRLRLGLDDGINRSFRQIAKEYYGGRMSPQTVRTMENKALKKLRSPVSLATYKLMAYLDFANVDMKTVAVGK